MSGMCWLGLAILFVWIVICSIGVICSSIGSSRFSQREEKHARDAVVRQRLEEESRNEGS